MAEVKWMRDGAFGVMVHYLSHVYDQEGRCQGDWFSLIEQFDVPVFCNEIAATGAKWLIFTYGQNTGLYNAPNPEIEKLLPGICSPRNLVKEIAVELAKRGIKLLAYLPTECWCNTAEVKHAFGWDIDRCDKTEFMKNWTRVMRYWAEDLGQDGWGWWFDGCYNSYEKNWMDPNEQGWDNSRFGDFAAWLSAAKAGNPQAVVAMCSGANTFKYVTRKEDYLAGESGNLDHLPDGKLVDGVLQWHTLLPIDCAWMHTPKSYPGDQLPAYGKIPPPKYKDNELFKYVKQWNAKGGAVTMNIGIYRDGSLAEGSLAQLKRLGNFLAEAN